MLRRVLLVVVLLSFPSGGHASDFWDEVRTPGLRAHVMLMQQLALAIRREEGTHALELVSRAAEPFRTRADTLVMRGLALGLTGQHEQAVDVFAAALAVSAAALDEPQWGTRAAMIAARAGRFALAADVLTRVVGNMPSLPARRDLFALLGDMLLAQGPDQLERAIVAYREALRGVGNTEARAVLGLALALSRHAEADAAREVAARLNAAARHEVVIATLPLPASEKSARLAFAADILGDVETASTHWQAAAAEAGPWQAHATAELRRLQQTKPSRARGRKP